MDKDEFACSNKQNSNFTNQIEKTNHRISIEGPVYEKFLPKSFLELNFGYLHHLHVDELELELVEELGFW